jgi:PAS domain S-box-containing protein
MRFRDLLTPDSRARFDDVFASSLAQDVILDVELELRRQDGRVLPVSMSATTVRDADGGYLMNRSTLFDLTERRRTEQALREAEQRLRAQLAEIEQIYRYAPVGLCNLDRECRYLRINERMAQINGAPPEAHIGRSIDEMVPMLADTLRATWRPVIERGEPVLDVEIHGRTPRDPDHDHDWLASYFPLSSDGEVIGLTAVVLDITERKRTEQALRASGRPCAHCR